LVFKINKKFTKNVFLIHSFETKTKITFKFERFI
jgi:hypothetical protein